MIRGEGRQRAEESKVIERRGGHRGIIEELKKAASSCTMHDIKKNENDDAKTKKEKEEVISKRTRRRKSQNTTPTQSDMKKQQEQPPPKIPRTEYFDQKNEIQEKGQQVAILIILLTPYRGIRKNTEDVIFNSNTRYQTPSSILSKSDMTDTCAKVKLG